MRLDELEANVGGAELLRSDLVIIRVETIKQLIALCRLQHETIDWAQQELIMWDAVEGYADDLYTDSLCVKALAAFDAFEKGEVK